MRSLDELLGIKGVLIACEFTPDGRCADYRAKLDLSSDTVNRSAQYIATITMMFNTLADAFTRERGMKWIPQQGWSYSGGDWTVVVGGNRAVFADSHRADFAELYAALPGEFVEERVEHRM